MSPRDSTTCLLLLLHVSPLLLLSRLSLIPSSSVPLDSSATGLLSSLEGQTWSQFIAQDRMPADSRSSSKGSDCENMRLRKEGASLLVSRSRCPDLQLLDLRPQTSRSSVSVLHGTSSTLPIVIIAVRWSSTKRWRTI